MEEFRDKREEVSMRIKKCDIYAYIIILFPVCNLLGGVFGNYDEVIGLIAVLYVGVWFAQKKLNETNIKIVIALLAVTSIGLLSNIFSNLITDIFPIAIDVLWLWKTFACFIYFSQICENNYICDRVVYVLSHVAKFTIILLLATSVIGQVVNIGVTGQEIVFGIKSFNFFWNNGIQTGWLIFCCIIILSLSHLNGKQYIKYFIAASVPLFLTNSSLVYCWILISLILYTVMKKNDVFKIRYIFLILFIVVMFTWGDLQTYFFSGSSSVRKTLIEKGIEVANMYFPLGSGFATYGSEMASRYYSKLYDLWGWRYSWAFGTNSDLLNDNFFGGLIGQFGWIGFVIYLYTLYKLLGAVNTKLLDKRIRVVAVSTVITIFAVMVGSASAKSIMGVCTFSVLGIVFGKTQSLKYLESE